MQKQYVIWTEEQHFIGIASIDDEHREIADRINQLIGEATNGTPSEAVKEMLNELILFVGEHFANEERLMLEHGYPELKSHADEHQRLLYQLKNVLKGDAKAILTPAFLIDWLEMHALKDDMKFGKHLTSQGHS